MISDDKILSICIPTFNRVKFLKECINSLIVQIDKNIQLLIDIYIFDNASTDGTQEYCKELARQNPYIKYCRNAENLGPDGNFYKILNFETNACFKHLLSDDDKYSQCSLKNLLEFLNKNRDQHFVYLNYTKFKTNNCDNLYCSLYLSAKSKINLSKYEFIEIIQNEFSFLSGMVFNCSKINLEGIDKFKNTNWLQSYALFNSTVESENKLAFYAPITVYKRDDDTAASYNLFKVFGENYYELTKFAYEKCFYDERQMLSMLSIRWKKLIYFAKLNKIDKSNYINLINICKKEKYLKSVIKYGRLPHWLCVLYHKLKVLLKRK